MSENAPANENVGYAVHSGTAFPMAVGGLVHAEVAVARLARRQHGAFSRQQALSAGISSSSLSRAVAGGRFVRPHSGVFVDIAVPATEEQVAMAAVLACGRGAAASHLTAARLWQLEVPAPVRPEVTVARPRQPRSATVRIHRSEQVGRGELARLGVIPITSPVRTLLDIAGQVDATTLELSLESLWRRRLVRPDRIEAYLKIDWRRRRRRADVLLRLARDRRSFTPTATALEALFLNVISDAGLPAPQRQHRVVVASGVRYLDFCYPDKRLAIELDGFEGRDGDRKKFDDDRLRQNEIEQAGYSFRRFTWTHLTRDRAWVQLTVGTALGLRATRASFGQGVSTTRPKALRLSM